MLDPLHIRAMRDEMQKIASRSTQGEHEEMTRARFKQTMKDLPVVIGGSALGYGLGRTLGDLGAEKLVKSEAGREQIKRWAPMLGTALSSAGAYALGQQRAIMAERRDAAQEAADKKKTSGLSPAEMRALGYSLGLGTGAGAGIGAGVGALTAEKGDRLRGAGRGALAGGAVGALGGGVFGAYGTAFDRLTDQVRNRFVPLANRNDLSEGTQKRLLRYAKKGLAAEDRLVKGLAAGIGTATLGAAVAGGAAGRAGKKKSAAAPATHITTRSPKFFREHDRSVLAQDTEDRPARRSTATMD